MPTVSTSSKALRAFIAKLHEAKYFEDVAESTLRELLSITKSALVANPLSKHARVLRSMAHLRPADGYQRLVIVDDAAQSQGAGRPAHLPSASAWRWVAQRAAPVAIDVPIGRVRAFADGASILIADGGFSDNESMQRLTTREASHLFAIPIRSMRGAIEGMVTVELACMQGIGEDFIFPGMSEDAELLVDIAAPYLLSLPLRPRSTRPTDELLPVMGQAMVPVVEMLQIFSQQEETLLIGGPTGAGKSRLARWCHAQSPRRDRPFEVLDLLTVPEDLQMAELCGWRKGAFTGAVRDAPGAVGRAMTGTLFLDEIDKLSLKAQASLLHLLESRRYRILGDTGREQIANVRFIVGSNANLPALVHEGRFREDLYYRINVLPVKLPPLDERRDEIAQWAAHMAERRHRESMPDGHARLSAGVDRLLTERTWPGNLRQLDNVVRRAYALSLMDQAGARDVVLEERHFLRALSYEARGVRRSLLDTLRGAAVAFVDEAERLAERGTGLDLDHADAFRGFVLGAAVERLGGRDAAFRMLGKAQQVQNRNHHKMMRREIDRVDALCNAIGEQDTRLFPGLADEDS